jgi:Domain of unknown function
MGPSAVHGAPERTGLRGRQPDPGIHNEGAVPAHAPEFVRAVTAEMMAGRGDDLPVSALPVDGTYPSGTTA